MYGSFGRAARSFLYAVTPICKTLPWITSSGCLIAAPPPLWELALPLSGLFTANKAPIILSMGPTAPAAIRWLLNTVFMAVMAMILTCITASMAGYALAKKRFPGRALLFSLIVCAMALPKQVMLSEAVPGLLR